MPTVVTLRLPADPASVARARHESEHLLRSVGAGEEVIDSTSLLVSEVVTNAVLHAGTEIDFQCRAAATGAHVAVADRSPLRAALRRLGTDATTGRGLLMVEAMASSHGTESTSEGKVVWFVVGDIDELPPPSAAGVPEETFDVTFLGLHVEMVRSTLAYGEAVLRELALLTAGEGEEEKPRQREIWDVTQFSLAPLLDALDGLSATSTITADVTVPFPVGAGERSLHRLALVDEGDQLAREGRLLTVPAVPEVAYCRRWVYRQIHQQASRHPPERWEPPEGLAAVMDAEELVAEDIEALAAATSVVVGDRGNRIVWVNEEAADLLGYRPDELVGRRLTVIIPDRFHLVHLAGFARHLATGEIRMLGTAASLPLRRSDDKEVLVELLLDAPAVPSARVLFRGRFRRAATVEPTDGG